tara:strand:- start:173 stop:553 length:381 start_codon:yes stop_codon:yes gene_type:complete
MTSSDKLSNIFFLRKTFMDMINNEFKDAYPEYPVDLSRKESQRVCREVALKGVEEMFEALGHLKNWKSHRKTDVPEFDKEDFLEEVVDAFNYFFSLLILTGVSESDFYEAFMKKDKIIRERIKNGY